MLIDRLVSVWVWGFVCAVSPFMLPVAALIRVLTGPFDRQRRVLHQFTNLWGSSYLWVSPYWKIRVEGRHRCQPGQAYVMVANHQSTLDIVVMHCTFLHFKWVSKASNFNLPFIGWNMRLNDYVPLQRGDRQSVMEMFDHARRHLQASSSILMFPEGSRSRDGRMKPFKPGAFQLALETGKPVLPILIEGTADALPKRGFVLQGRHVIKLTVLEPVSPTTFEGETPESLATRVRSVLMNAQEEAAND